jgi:hypothetical protein
MNNINNFAKPSLPSIVPQDPSVTLPRSTTPRRNQVLYVRVTATEKEAIVERAVQARLSVSRYLTQFALEGRAPLPADEKKRLEDLVALFKRTEISVGHLWVQASEYKLFSALPAAEEDFALATQTLSGLTRELSKRL